MVRAAVPCTAPPLATSQAKFACEVELLPVKSQSRGGQWGGAAGSWRAAMSSARVAPAPKASPQGQRPVAARRAPATTKTTIFAAVAGRSFSPRAARGASQSPPDHRSYDGESNSQSVPGEPVGRQPPARDGKACQHGQLADEHEHGPGADPHRFIGHSSH